MHAEAFFAEVQEIARTIDVSMIEKMAQELASVRDRKGRLFLLGVGGSAGNCSHAVNDFRKLAGLEERHATHYERVLAAYDEAMDAAAS